MWTALQRFDGSGLGARLLSVDRPAEAVDERMVGGLKDPRGGTLRRLHTLNRVGP